MNARSPDRPDRPGYSSLGGKMDLDIHPKGMGCENIK